MPGWFVGRAQAITAADRSSSVAISTSLRRRMDPAVVIMTELALRRVCTVARFGASMGRAVKPRPDAQEPRWPVQPVVQDRPGTLPPAKRDDYIGPRGGPFPAVAPAFAIVSAANRSLSGVSDAFPAWVDVVGARQGRPKRRLQCMMTRVLMWIRV